MSARYPLDLPQYPVREGLNIEALDNVIRAETNTGPGLDRAGELAEWFQVKCSIVLKTDNQRDVFQRWHRDTLQQGTQLFAWPALDRVIGDTVHGYNLKFTSKPKYTPRGASGWTVAMELVSLPAAPPVPLLDDGVLSGYATFTRASSATRRGPDGNTETLAAGAPRLDYDTNGDRLGLLIEGPADDRAGDDVLVSNGVWAATGGSTFRGAFRYSADRGEPCVLSTANSDVYQNAGAVFLSGRGELVADRDDAEPGDVVHFVLMVEAHAGIGLKIGRAWNNTRYINSHVIDVSFQERRITTEQARRELGL